MLINDASNMKKYTFQFLEVICTQGSQMSARYPNFSMKNWGLNSIDRNLILSNLDMNFIFEYVNLMFLKDFETFISQKNSRQKKLYIKHNKVAQNAFLGILSTFTLRLRDLGVIFVGNY